MTAVDEKVIVAIRQANSCLSGSPYSFPEDDAGLQRLADIGKSLLEIQKKLDVLSNMDNLPAPLSRILKVREIYESNAIEGLGPDVATTSKIIDTSSSVTNFMEWAVNQGLKNDKHAYDVIGLTSARELSRTFSREVDRPITEIDIRGLHKIIMGDDSRSGIYKPYPNAIQGNESHQTALPTDTPAKMEEFCDWMNKLSRRGFQTLESIVKAAAVHAWLAHIHPFDDGNGRVSRLLANLVLTREGMPPLILRHKGDRERYINALAFSDEGGDISRLILVFCRSIERVIEEMSDPQTAQEYFDADIDLRLSGDFRYWKSFMDEWTQEAIAQLRLLNLKAVRVGDLQPSDFRSLRKGKPASKAWFLQITSMDSDEVLGLWQYGYLPGWTLSKLEKDQHFPCLLFSVPNPEPLAVKPFITPKHRGKKNITGLMIEPTEKSTYIWGEEYDAIRKVSIKEAATKFASTCLSYALEPYKNN
jgi:Fic family protein